MSSEDVFDRLSQGDIFDQVASNQPQNSISSFTEKNQKAELEGHPYGLASYVAQHPKEAAAGVGTTLVEPVEQIANLSQPGGLLKSLMEGHVKTPIVDKIKELAGVDELPAWAKDEATILNFLSTLIPVERLAQLGGKGAKAISQAGKEVVEGKILPSQAMKEFREREAIMEGTLKPREVTTVPETFESGLSKPRAVEAAHPERAVISKAHKRKVIEGLEKEAQSLIKARVSERIPISQKIQEGFDFPKHYEEEFGKLKQAAEKFNPEIDIEPLSKFFSETREKYRGIPELHGDAKSVLRETKLFSRRFPEDLKTLLKVRRSNGQKLNQIYEQRLLKGKRAEYADFLNNMNRKIDEAIEKTLPENSAWFKKYKELNNEYRLYRNAQDTQRFLEPVLKEKLSTTAITKIAENPDKQKYLKIKMGDEGGNEVIQIAKDLKAATESIKKMTVKEFNKFDSIWPLAWIFKPAGIAATLKKGYDSARRGYGYILSTPARREAFDDALKAVAHHDLSAYEKATKNL